MPKASLCRESFDVLMYPNIKRSDHTSKRQPALAGSYSAPVAHCNYVGVRCIVNVIWMELQRLNGAKISDKDRSWDYRMVIGSASPTIRNSINTQLMVS